MSVQGFIKKHKRNAQAMFTHCFITPEYIVLDDFSGHLPLSTPGIPRDRLGVFPWGDAFCSSKKSSGSTPEKSNYLGYIFKASTAAEQHYENLAIWLQCSMTMQLEIYPEYPREKRPLGKKDPRVF